MGGRWVVYSGGVTMARMLSNNVVGMAVRFFTLLLLPAAFLFFLLS